MFSKPRTIIAAVIAFGLPAVAHAQDETKGPEYIDKPEASESDEGRKQGLSWRITAGANVAVGDNQSVVGQVDGTSVAFGYSLDTVANVNHDEHEWRNNLALGAGVTRTPIVPEFVKSRDDVLFESIYLYHLIPMFGPFAKVKANTAMFRGSDIRPEPVDYLITRPDGTADTFNGDTLTLTDPFRPLRLQESLGVFFQPLAKEAVSIEARAGGGARQTFADGQLAITDDDATPEIEGKELEDTFQLGTEYAVEVWGSFVKDRVTYKASAVAMIPHVHTELPAGDDRSSIDLTNVELAAGLSFKLVSWASLDYQFKALREPQLLDEWQLQNNLLLTIGLSATNIVDEEDCPCAE